VEWIHGASNWAAEGLGKILVLRHLLARRSDAFHVSDGFGSEPEYTFGRLRQNPNFGVTFWTVAPACRGVREARFVDTH